MSLASAYTNNVGRIPELFSRIRDGQAPEQFTLQLLKDWGFGSSNDRPFLPLLKALGFLSPDGKPTALYHDYRDHSRSKAVMARALRDSYSDIFLIKANPTASDKEAIQGKFKSFHNASDNVASLMAKTFLALLGLADLSTSPPAAASPKEVEPKKGKASAQQQNDTPSKENPIVHPPGLHYNIQIHLPATKDVEVYNAIFKSLKDHLFE